MNNSVSNDINKNFQSTFEYNLIYVFSSPYPDHEGCLKVGKASLNSNKLPEELPPNCKELNDAARKRINGYTGTYAAAYNLLHTELAITNNNESFMDTAVHDVLNNSGIKKKKFMNETEDGEEFTVSADEWFKTDIENVKEAIKAVKSGLTNINGKVVENSKKKIKFRPEQEDAIKGTIKYFKKHPSGKYLWNAKMRFGKTYSCLEAIKRMSSDGVNKTIIFTHRPVVNGDWRDSFNVIFSDVADDYYYISKDENGDETLRKALTTGKKIIYFASIQDLRGSSDVSGQYDKNKLVFDTVWDLVVIDEAHEGTMTNLGSEVVQKIVKPELKKTRLLELSGTPFKLLATTDFTSDNTFTWDYIDEQSRKNEWMNKCLDVNPYEDMPQMHIWTYDLKKEIGNKYLELEDKAFNFTEFFKVEKKGPNAGKFVHEDDINKFLDLISKANEESKYPYSTPEYRNLFKHTLWMVPGVSEANALKLLLEKHTVFGWSSFKIINATGDDGLDAYEDVKEAINKAGENGYTITLSCGRLTTGTTIPEWTACFLLKGSVSTEASSYLQTIFRVQGPCKRYGKQKTRCYVFDFAPDRTLKMVAAAVSLGKTGKGRDTQENRERLAQFLNFCPVISLSDTGMKEYNTNDLMRHLNRAYAEKAVESGFDDNCIYSDELLIKLSEEEAKLFNDLKQSVGKTDKEAASATEVEINSNGFTEEQYEQAISTPAPKKELTPEQEEIKRKMDEAKKQKNNLIKILRGISIRIPLLIYGADIDFEKDIDINKFVELVDNKSWEEFMPKGVTKEKFNQIKKYYDNDVFIDAAYRIRAIAKSADSLPVEERVKQIARLFSKFKNPDKETVLTPWRVVEMHLGETLGGWSIWDTTKNDFRDNATPVEPIVNIGKAFNGKRTTLELGAKSGLYSLYAAFSIFKNLCAQATAKGIDINSEKKQDKLWKYIIENCIFGVCNTKMARTIARRTLCGYKDIKPRVHCIEELVNKLDKTPHEVIKKISPKNYWLGKDETGNMHFDMVLGNPPYTVGKQQIYPHFYNTAIQLGDVVSLIFPVGWQEPKTANGLGAMNKKEVKEDKQIVYIDNKENVFPGISGAQFTNVILWKKGYDNGLDGKQKIYTDGKEPTVQALTTEKTAVVKPPEITRLAEIVEKTKGFEPLQGKTSVRKPYGLSTDVLDNSYNTEKDNVEKYGIPNIDINYPGEIPLYGLYKRKRVKVLLPNDYPIPRKTDAFSKYKIFVSYTWGNMDETTGLGGAFSDIVIGEPDEICTETYQESGNFDVYETAQKHSKYLLTKFVRALLYKNKHSRHSTTAWGTVPVQDYSEPWWDTDSIDEIDEHLFEKYNVPEDIREFVRKNIQPRTVDNIVNYKKKELNNTKGE